MCGIGVGATIFGIKPIVEIQFQGFSYPSFQQLMTHAARYRNRSRGRFTVPMVLRMPMGMELERLSTIPKPIEAMFAHIPGIKVVIAFYAIRYKRVNDCSYKWSGSSCVFRT
ncbi:hypothetical protein [Mycoplasmopsis cynos]|uniref:hypothetical protein n=1 Tax=Mycoplasmopsis cynos TaxID=171284 RepID=UPI002FF1CB35